MWLNAAGVYVLLLMVPRSYWFLNRFTRRHIRSLGLGPWPRSHGRDVP
jgi:hypothetical protein